MLYFKKKWFNEFDDIIRKLIDLPAKLSIYHVYFTLTWPWHWYVAWFINEQRYSRILSNLHSSEQMNKYICVCYFFMSDKKTDCYRTLIGHLQFLSANPTEPTSFANTAVEVRDFPFYCQPQCQRRLLDICRHALIHDLHEMIILQNLTTIW